VWCCDRRGKGTGARIGWDEPPIAAAWLAWSLWALSVMLTALSLLLLVSNLTQPNTHIYNTWLDNTLNAVFFSTVGAFVASRRPENLVG
jgi:hypothetical protein